MDLSRVTGIPPRGSAEAKSSSPENPGGDAGSLAIADADPNRMVIENERGYHRFQKGMYMYPCDDQEQDRLDIFHKVLQVARSGDLHSAPVPPPPVGQYLHPGNIPRILDLGCGTGIWAIDMAKRYPYAQVFGTDIAPIQPQINLPPNLQFDAPRDFESPWMMGEDSFDLIHLQMGCGSVSNWSNLYRKAIRHLRPGTGYFEQVEIAFEPRSDKVNLEGTPLHQWWHHLREAAEHPKPIAYNISTGHLLSEAGFVDIQHQLIGLPLNKWSQVEHEKEVGKWYSLAFTESVEPLLLGPLTRVKNWNLADIKELARRAAIESYDAQCEPYNLLHIWTARRP